MHRTLKGETTKPAGQNSLQQQARFDAFQSEFNTERAHEALAMKMPAEVYWPSARLYTGLSEVVYPFHDKTITITNCGHLCMLRKKDQYIHRSCRPNAGHQRS